MNLRGTCDKEVDRMKTGLVLEGGALRGLFTAGAMDYLQDKNATFDYIAGVSAGAGNMMNFLSHQRGRTKTIISPGRKDNYYGLKQLIRTGSYLNLDKMIFEFSYKTFPYNFQAHKENPIEHEIVVVNGRGGVYQWKGRRQAYPDSGKSVLFGTDSFASGRIGWT